MDKTREKMILDSEISSKGKTSRELELELQNAKMALAREEQELESEREINRLLREKCAAQQEAMEQIRGKMNKMIEEFQLESKKARKALNASIQAYKDAIVEASSGDDYLQYCKRVQIGEGRTAYDVISKVNQLYHQYVQNKQDRLLALEAAARKQSAKASAISNRIYREENPERKIFFDFDDEDVLESNDLDLKY